MSSRKLLLKATGLGKTYSSYRVPSHRLLHRFSDKYRPQQTRILNDLDLELHEGEVVGILGCNGAGKTTLLRILSGILLPSEGELLTTSRICPVLDLGFGMVDDLTGRDNIYFVGSLRGFTHREMGKRIEQIISFASIGTAIDDPIQHYSTGMKMRLAYAVSTHLDPEIMIIDEALAVGDEGFQHKCFEHLRQLANQGVGIVFVSHSSQAIRELCDRAILLDQGELLQTGEPSRVIESYHRLLFAPEAERTDIRTSILHNQDRDNDPSIDKVQSDKQQAIFDPSLSSEPVVYPEQGASLSGFTITDGSGKKVNLLLARQQYRYQFKVTFSEELFNVRFGMLIKSLTGFEIGGSETSHQRTQVSAGETLTLSFPFTCNLNPGNYYMNAGVLAPIDGEETFVARVIDALQFKVLPNEYHQTGQVDFGIDPEIQRTSD